jgi:hypothetical protein
VSVFIKDEAKYEALRRTYDAALDHQGVMERLPGNTIRYKWEIKTPAGRHFGKRHFYLYLGTEQVSGAEEQGPMTGNIPETYIKIGLFSSSGNGKVSGSFADGNVLEIELIAMDKS